MDRDPALAVAPVDALLKTALLFDRRANFTLGVDCNCYHDSGHDFRGCLEIDEATGEYCPCNHVTGAVEYGDREMAENLVGQMYSAMLEADTEELARIVDAIPG
jgi:hypothetical protein